MKNWDNRIDEKKVFLDLFNIYEQELLTIFQYIAPINNTCVIKDSEWKKLKCKINLNVSWNKIHELHLRVCAECENLMKGIAKKLYPDRNFDEEYQNKKTKKIMEKLRNFSERDKQWIKKEIFRYADFQFFLGILSRKLWLCKKKIEFFSLVEINPDKQISLIQPFEINNSSKSLPKWWDNYNKIKHDKFNNYINCTLWDLINSLWAYYILLNYFVLDINIPITDDEKIKSKIFKPTVWRVQYELDLLANYWWYREKDPRFFKDVYLGDKKIIPWYYNDETMKLIQKKLDEAHKNFVLSDIKCRENCAYLNNENYLFYNLYKQQGVIIVDYVKNQTVQQPWRTLKIEKRFNLPK